MSRIGKLPITLGDKVKATVDSGVVHFEGPKGKKSVPLPERVAVEIKDGVMHVTRENDEKKSRAMHGLARAILANAAEGVGKGFERRLDIRGVGFRAEVKGKTVHFNLGFSHPVTFDLPEGVTAEVDKQQRTEDSMPTIGLTLRSNDKELIGSVAVKMRALRPPEPYKGKGIKYAEERVRRKEGKTGTA
ncbi:MAG TPA: 50S ribosomal protein L6 [Myxococcaceae bacterium]|nr:50S ribosomal protein L6 [Myxococcaceae bacterium]